MNRKNTIRFLYLTALVGCSLPSLSLANSRDIRERIKWVNTGALELTIEDLKGQKGFDYAKAKQKLSYIKKNLPSVLENINGKDSTLALTQAKEIIANQRDITLSNPALDMDKIVVTKFGLGKDARRAFANKMCMPFSNYMGLIETPSTGYNAEICELSDLRSSEMKKRTIFKPECGEGIADVQMHWDADRLIFATPKPTILDGFYNQEYHNWHIYEIGVDGNNLKHISKAPEQDLEYADPCYLPDGRILFTTNIGYNGIPCEHGERVIMNLALYDPKDNSMRKITFDQDGNWSPTVLNNGRIMYTRYEYTDLTHYFTRIIMHSNPDGTECKALYGSNSYWPTSVYDMQQLPNAGNKFVGIVSGHHGVPRSGKLIVFDPAQGRQEADGVVQEIPFSKRKVEPIVKDRLVDGIYPQFSRPFPLNDKYFLVSAKPHKDALWGIYLVDIFDNMTLIEESEGTGYITPIPVKKRETPPVIPDKVNLKETEATVFIQDIYEGQGLQNVPKGTVKKLRLFAYEYAYLKSPSDFDALGVQSGWDLKRELGTVDVEKDGSVIFKIPANTPVSIQPLDENGHAIQWMRSWFTAMPGEVVSCVGCHEDQNTVPLPKRVLASTKKPANLQAPVGGTRPFSFENEIQPILDKYCISCHDGSSEAVDLTGKDKTEYVRWGNYTTHRFMKNSYLALHPYVYRQGPEAEIKVLDPYEYHGSNSELIQMLEKGHNNVKLDSMDMNTLYKWVDFNAPYFGDLEISGRYKATFEQYPRRQQLMRKYANVSTDWKKELADYANYLKTNPATPVKPEPVKSAKVDWKKVNAWGFNADEARQKQQASNSVTEKVIEIAPGVNMNFTWIPEGQYMKGKDKGARHAEDHKKVHIKKGFWMATIEVTNQQIKALMPEHDSRYIGQQWKDHTTPGYSANEPAQPAVRVTWENAKEYCKLLSEKTGLNIKLPTEEQWEWACRAGSTDDMWYGDRSAEYSNYENMADFTIKDLAVWGLEPTVPMPDGFFCRQFWDFVPRDKASNDKNLISAAGAQYQANPWGLYDMHGNVAEWTDSDSDESNFDQHKIVKGGSWRDRASKSTASSRRYYRPWQAPYNVGFRVIID